MMPLSYRLREGVRLEEADRGWRVVSELPLCLLLVNGAAARLLSLMKARALSVAELAAAGGVDERDILRLCEKFRDRGLLDVLPPPPASDEEAPSVSVIVPCKDRQDELDACLEALQQLDYPAEKLEIVVVDDGSTDATAAVASARGCVVLRNQRNRGQSYSRNLAAARASGEILAFIDSDCVADPAWLRHLVPFFAANSVAAAGGYVAGRHATTALERYEAKMSSLNLGERLLLAGAEDGTFYMPTCNLLVRRRAYLDAGGIREDLRVGEDVDLCWRLRDAGAVLVYAPAGRVEHRHRTSLVAMLKRRAQYGTSEALLHGLHRRKRKRMVVPLPALLTLSAIVAALLLHPVWLAGALLVPGAEVLHRTLRLRRRRAGVRLSRVWFAVLRGHTSFLYFACFHLVRYYLVALLAAGLVFPRLGLLAALALLYAALVDFSLRRPRLGFAAFAFYYAAEHSAYQAGVFAGCLRRRSFRSYRLALAGGAGWRGRTAPRAGDRVPAG